jgi:hypothetical protein
MPMSTMSAFSAPITRDTLALYTSPAPASPHLQRCDSMSTLVGKDFEKAVGALQPSQGLRGAPVVAPAAKKNTGLKALFKRAFASAPIPAPTPTPTSGGKDFGAAFGALQSSYGMCGAPVVTRTHRKR